MPDDLYAIRCGLAAQLRTVLDHHDGHVSPYPLDNPAKTPCLQVGPMETAEPLAFGSAGGYRYVFLIEGLFSLHLEVAAWKWLDTLVGQSSIDDAIQADPSLTSRLDEHNTLTTGEDPACADSHVTEYRGAARATLPDGERVLQGIWAVEVIT